MVVFGSTGVGKTTLVNRIADEFALPIIDLDKLLREAEKSDSPEKTFLFSVIESVNADSWIIDGSYTSVQAIIWPRAEAIIWLDFSFWVFFFRLIKRSLYRIFIRKSSERPIREKNQPAHERTLTYLHAIFTNNQRRQRHFATLFNSKNAHLHIIRLCNPKDAEDWLNLLTNNQR